MGHMGEYRHKSLYTFTKSRPESGELREGSKIPIWVYIGAIYPDKFGIGYRQAVIKYKNAVLGKLIVDKNGNFVAITSTKYELIPNEVIKEKLLRLGFTVEHEDEVMLVMAREYGGKTVYVVNAMDGSHALKIVVRSQTAMLPVVYRKHMRSVNEVVERLEELINESLEWFGKVEGVIAKKLEEPVSEMFIEMLKDYEGLPEYVKRSVLSAYHRVAGIYQMIRQPVPAINLYRSAIQSILNRQTLSWDGKLNLIREVNKLFGVLDVLEKLTQ